ncbi:MAG: hypothetical protein IT460_13700 [Planctomycetes bacterium]|nr:hypothetical protein [Planctomycetota bacterium]
MGPRTLAAVVLVAGAALPARPALPADAPAPVPAPALAPRFVGPRTGPARAAALTQHGGDAASERAVEAALDWLARHEAEEGGWDADGFPARCAAGAARCDGVGRGQHGEDVPCPFDAAITALATLAFLGAGHGPWVEGDRHGAVVERALARCAAPDDAWSLALGTQALAEAEAMEGRGRRRDAALAGAKRLVAARQADGGWTYAAGFRRGSDVPYAALVVPALVAARDVGAPWPDGLADGVGRWLDTLEADEGRLAYLADGRAYGYTPTAANGLAAAAVRAWLVAGADGPRQRAHLALAARLRPTWAISWKDVEVPGQGRRRVQVGHLSFYEWWYGSMATFQAGGDAWAGWFARAKAALVPHQRTDGCARGSWDPVAAYERQTGGRVFATALGAMILETPYRHRRVAR